jgi:hypothetical protein
MVRLIFSMETCRDLDRALTAGKYIKEESGEKVAAKDITKMIRRFWVLEKCEYGVGIGVGIGVGEAEEVGIVGTSSGTRDGAVMLESVWNMILSWISKISSGQVERQVGGCKAAIADRLHGCCALLLSGKL